MNVKHGMILVGLIAVVALMMACGGRKHDAAYYEQMVDRIRKAEQVAELQRKASMVPDSDPVDAWFDTLSVRTLPIRNAGDDIARLSDFKDVPAALNDCFGFTEKARLKAVAMPAKHAFGVVMLAEIKDSLNTVLYLYTMKSDHMALDHLCIYETKDERRDDDHGKTMLEYYITSNYETTLMLYYQSHDTDRKPELLNSRQYIINDEGRFEETIINL